MRDYFEQLYGNKMDNLEEMEIMNNPITSTEIEAVIKKKKISLKAKAQDQTISQENSPKHLEKS